VFGEPDGEMELDEVEREAESLERPRNAAAEIGSGACVGRASASRINTGGS